MGTVSRRPRSLDAQGLPEQHDGSRRSPNVLLGELCVPGVGDPPQSTGPIPPMGLRLGGRQPCFTQWESRTA
jgi:hypothetical protein